MLYPECERTGSNQMSQAHQHLNLLSSHLNQADYLATAAMALSPKYNTAFNVTNLLNPVLEESYRKQQEAYNQQQFKSEPLVQSSRSSNINGATSTASAALTPSSLSSSSSSSSVKHPSPISATASAPPSSSSSSSNQPSSYQTSTTPTSSTSSSSFSSASLIVPSPSLPGANTLSAASSSTIPPYFNYQSGSQFNQSNLMAAAAHHSHHMQHNPAHYHSHYGLPTGAYPSPYGSGSSSHHGMHASVNSNGSSSASSISSTDAESMGYVNQQLQYSNPGNWYTNPNDPRFSSNC
jgi:hypothetical protein